MKNNEFAHLHGHNEYSYLDGYGSAEAYAKRCKELGFEYLALTNHGNVDGLIKFQKACDKEGIKPILGCELYIVPDMSVKKKGSKNAHLTILVENQKGWVTLCKLLTIANLEGFYSRPRVDFKTILEHDLSGLYFLTACCGSFLNLKGGIKFLSDLRKEVGDEKIWFEIMPHEIPAQHKYHEFIKDNFNLDEINLIATNDYHYILEHQWETQEVLLAINSNATWNSPKRWKFEFKGLHLRTADEMMIALKAQGDFSRKEILKAMKNTLVVAEKCSNFRIPKQDICLPNVPNIEEEKVDDVLYNSCLDAIDIKFGIPLDNPDAEIPKKSQIKYNKYQDRFDEEFELISKKNFSKYFLIVKDFIDYCKKDEIGVGPGRGSVGGSLTAYLLGITKTDPIEYDLLFSRFLSENRIDWPDIDIDVEKRFRQEAIKYIYATYGENNVCSISTLMKMKAKAATRDVGRVFEIPGYDVNSLANAIWENKEIDGSAVKYAVENTSEGRDFADKYPKELAFIIELENQARGSGRHAAGIVISGKDLTTGEQCVLVNRNGFVVANWDMSDCEYCGLMKLDVLGLATISVINEAVRLINTKPGASDFVVHETDISDHGFSIDEIPLDDQKAFDLMSEGKTAGIFQLSGKPLTRLCKDMGIDSLDDIVAANALVRPGPMQSGMTDIYIKRKHGEGVEKTHRIYDKITQNTYGILVYQEQVMQVISRMAGMSESDADKIRKVIAKKSNKEDFEKYKKEFILGCREQKTFTDKQAVEFWAELQEWARYGFGKAHSTAYSIIAYQTGYLKTNYPAEFFAATLTYGEYNEKSRDENKHKQYVIDEAIEYGFTIMPPKTKFSDPTNWVAIDDILYAPFVELKGIGESNAVKCNEVKAKPKMTGFFNVDPSPKKKTKIDQIMEAIHGEEDEYIPDREILDEYLSFKIKNPRKKYVSEDVVVQKNKRFREEVKISTCVKCGLREEANSPILSSIGKYNAYIIGEAPGLDEDEGVKLRNGDVIHTAFIGKAGQELWNSLKVHKIERSDLFVSTVCRCYPSKTGTPKPKHTGQCLPYLINELRMNQCRLILALGNTCLSAFTGRSGGITNLSGTMEWVQKLNAYVVWGINPSAVLKNRKTNEPHFKKAIKKFAETFNKTKK